MPASLPKGGRHVERKVCMEPALFNADVDMFDNWRLNFDAGAVGGYHSRMPNYNEVINVEADG